MIELPRKRCPDMATSTYVVSSAPFVANKFTDAVAADITRGIDGRACCTRTMAEAGEEVAMREGPHFFPLEISFCFHLFQLFDIPRN